MYIYIYLLIVKYINSSTGLIIHQIEKALHMTCNTLNYVES